jgi:PAS domain S-box-containing protein
MDHVDRTYDILLLDDNAVDRMTVRRQLTKSALLHSLADSASIHELNASLAVRSYDCLLVDDSILGSDGRELLLGLREAHPDLAIITLAEVDDRESAVRLIKLGASEILVKSWATPALLSQSIRSSVRNARTERAARVAEDARDRSERRFRSLAEAIPLMVWTANAALWLEYVNQNYTAFTGFDFAQANTQGGVLAGYHPHDVEGALRCWVGAQAERVAFEYQHRQLSKDTQSYRWQTTRAEPLLDERGEVLQWVGTTIDTNEQRRREEQLAAAAMELERARQEAERLNRAKDEFLAVLSHELRTPLNAISGWLQVLRGGDESERALESIWRNARRLTRNIEDLAEVLRGACESVLPVARERGVELRAAIPDRLAEVNGDPSRLQQVAWNLLANAIQSSDAGGVVWIQARLDGGKVSFCVRDSGSGIDPDFLPHIFQRFRQEDGSRTRRRGGLGLGLSIVKQIVDLLNGEIDARSDGPGKGAEFSVAFSVSERIETACAIPCAAMHGPNGLPNRPLEGMSVLLADDDDDSREMLAFALERKGATVTGVSSAEACRDAYALSEPDVLVSDIGMPGEDGYALIESLRRRGARAFAVALTGYAALDDRERAHSAGFDVHLTKPVVLEQLVASLVRARS